MLWQMSADVWMISFSIITCLTFIIGWITDRLMGSIGFGALGNWMVILIGVYLGLYAYNVYGYPLDWYPLQTLAVMVGSGFLMLFSLTFVKRFLFD